MLPSTRQTRLPNEYASIPSKTIMPAFFGLDPLLDGFSMGYGNEKRTVSDEAATLCGIVEDYRTFAEDFKRVLEFVEWLEDGEYCCES